MERAALAFLALLLVSIGARADVPLSFTLAAPANTSAGVFDQSGTLVRTLWNNVAYGAQVISSSWDGRDDDGRMMPDGDYQARLRTNNVQYEWEGVVGNTSDNFTGSTLHHPLDVIFGMAVVGTNIYFATGYNEQGTSAFKTTVANPQQRSALLGKGANSYCVVSDGSNVYWTAADPHISENSFIYATRVADDAEAVLSSAVPVAVTYGRTYTSAFGALAGAGSRYSGLAVQQSGPFVFASRKALNRLDVFDKSTGAAVRTLTFTRPGALTVSGNGDLWMVLDGTTVARFEVAPDGTLTQVASVAGLDNALAIAVSPDDTLLVVADGGASQQLKAFANAAPWTPVAGWPRGLAGGYANGPEVTDDKFYFRNTGGITLGSDVAGPGGDLTYLAFQPDGKLWVGDSGNVRSQRFNPDGTLFDRVEYMPLFYSAGVDPNNPTRVFANFLEFQIDYSKPLGPRNGSWTLVKNWGWGVPADLLDQFFLLRSVTTFPNGRTYALLRDNAGPVQRGRVVELPPSGNLRLTSQHTPTLNYVFGTDGALRGMNINAEGEPLIWSHQPLTDFDAANDPLWAASTVFAQSPPTVRNYDVATEGGAPWVPTASGLVLAYGAFSNHDGWHLEALDPATGRWKWKSALSTGTSYAGPFPGDGYFDVANNMSSTAGGGFSPYAGGGLHSIGSQVFWEYHGEGWKGGQTNAWTHLYEDGLMVGRFGVAEATWQTWLVPEGMPGMAGNAFSSAAVTGPDGSIYIYHNDESWHGGVHRWNVTGLETIAEHNMPIHFASGAQPGLRGSYHRGTGLADVSVVNERLDPVIDFAWGAGAPAGTVLAAGESYSVRWSGFISPRFSETFAFHLTSADGARLWIDGKLIVDAWTDHPTTETSGTITLEAGRNYPIRIEYYRRANEARVSLAWSSPSQVREVVPASRLKSVAVPGQPAATDLLAGLRFTSVVEDGAYGWHLSPANGTASWKVDTSAYEYHREAPVDIRAKFNGVDPNETRSAMLYRDLQAPGAPGKTHWSVQGRIVYLGLPNQADYGGAYSTGHYLEVLDPAGRIIARMNPKAFVFPNDFRVLGNNATVAQVGGTNWTDQSRDFTIEADLGQITFAYGGNPPVTTNLLDPAANWMQPASLRVFFWQSRLAYGPGVGLQALTFSASGPAATPLVLGTTLGGTISAPGQEAAFTFAGSSGQSLSLAITSPVFAPAGALLSVNVFGPSGQLVASGNGVDGVTLALPSLPGGSYTVMVTASASAVGSFAIMLAPAGVQVPVPAWVLWVLAPSLIFLALRRLLAAPGRAWRLTGRAASR